MEAPGSWVHRSRHDGPDGEVARDELLPAFLFVTAAPTATRSLEYPIGLHPPTRGLMYALDLRATRSDWPAVAVLGGAVKMPPRALTGQGQLAEPLRGRRTGQRCPPREPEFLAVVEARDAMSLPRMKGDQAIEPAADVADHATVDHLDLGVGRERRLREGRGNPWVRG